MPSACRASSFESNAGKRRSRTSETRAQALAFLTAFVTLFAQILVHRMVAVKLVNNFAFLVISLTMLGFALSGTLLTRWRQRLLEDRDNAVLSCAAAFAVSLLVAASVFYHAPAGPQWSLSRLEFIQAFLRIAPLSLLFAVPFVFCGLILGLLLSSPDLPVRRVYFFDLVGSSAGAVAVVPAISALGAETGCLVASGVMLSGTWLLTSPRRFGHLAAGAGLLSVALATAFRDGLFEMSYPTGSVLAAARIPDSGYVLEHVAWDPVARIEVSRIPVPDPENLRWPYLVGESRAFLSRFGRVLTQNNTAFTYAVHYDGSKGSLRGIDQTLYAAAYEASSVSGPRVLVIGVGGGFDVLNALYYDASQVTGVEVNEATIRILTERYRDYFRGWVEDPRVRLVQEEGRLFLTRHRERFDVIQLSGVDTVSGTPAAAYVFSENYLYTAEAFDLYLARLSDRGILNMMRHEYVPPREMLRALTTAIAALRRAGSRRPADHILMITARGGLFTTMLVKKTPFDDAERRRLQSWAGRSRFFDLSAAPHLNDAGSNAYQAFLSIADPAQEAVLSARYPFDVRPVEDDRPFFFKYSYWWHLATSDPIARASIPVMEIGLILLLALTGSAALICIYLPLRQLSRTAMRSMTSRRYGAFFLAIGLGYMAIEVALLQKFGLFLGHPNYALSVVLAALLLATGLGSLFSEAIVRALGHIRFAAYLLALLAGAERLIVLPHLQQIAGLHFAARAAIVCALVMPIGICLGTFFPTAMERLKSADAALVPWAWGINGIASVVAPVLSVAVAVTWGISTLLVAALPAYMAAGFILPSDEPG
jgi:spermidine synthase